MSHLSASLSNSHPVPFTFPVWAGRTQQDIQHTASALTLLCQGRGASKLLSRFHRLHEEVHAATSQVMRMLLSQRRDGDRLHQLRSCSATTAGCVLEAALREKTWAVPRHCPAESQRHAGGRKQCHPCCLLPGNPPWGTLQLKALVLQGARAGEMLYNT